MKNPFTKHPESIGESYFAHFIFAGQFATNMFLGGIACLIHAIFPFLFIKTGSNFLLKMTRTFIDRMPHVDEERINQLCELIEKKRKTISSSSS